MDRDVFDVDHAAVDHAAVGAGKKATFAVYEAPVEEGNDSLGEKEG